MKASSSGKHHLSREALALYQTASQSYELAKDGELPYALAYEHFQNVSSLCAKLDRSWPHTLDVLHLWSRAEFELGHYLEAVTLLEQALKLDQSDPALWYSYGYAHLALRELATARTAFNTALQLDPHATRADLGLAHCLFLQESWVEAFQHYRALQTRYPQDKFVKQQIICVLAKLKADEYNEELESDLITYLSFTELDIEPLSFFSASLLKHKFTSLFSQLPQLKQHPKANKKEPIIHSESVLIQALEQLIADPLFNSMLHNITLCDCEIETALIACRSQLMYKVLQYQKPLTDSETAFCLNLALHQLRSEFALAITDKETQLIDEVRSLLYQSFIDQQNTVVSHQQSSVPSASNTKLMLLPETLEPIFLIYNTYDSLASLLHTSNEAQTQQVNSASNNDLITSPLNYIKSFNFPENWQHWLQQAVDLSDQLQQTDSKIEVCSTIHSSSTPIRHQYEQNPYPKWQYLPARTPNDYARALQQQLMARPALSEWDLKFLNKPKLKMLVAGCGTGRHALHLAQNFEQLDITAIDVSRTSLCYAHLKARQLNAEGIRFYQGDILTLPTDWQFDLIECSGVLHHMANPLLGLKRLREMLCPGGLIKLGLYSQIARRDLLKLRAGLKKHCIASLTNKELRDIRSSLLEHQNNQLMTDILASPDFYSLSGFRDLLLHVQEQDYTPKTLLSLLQHAKLHFMGFSNLSESTKQLYRKDFPEDFNGADLINWENFEHRHPHTFGHMYQFFCKKPTK